MYFASVCVCVCLCLCVCLCGCLFLCVCDKQMDGQTNECMNEVGFACLLLTRCPKAICGHRFPCPVVSVLIIFCKFLM